MKTVLHKGGSGSFEDRLDAYDREARAATAASTPRSRGRAACACTVAAGALLGLAQPSLAAIHYSGPQNIALPANGYAAINLNWPGETDYDFVFANSTTQNRYNSFFGTYYDGLARIIYPNINREILFSNIYAVEKLAQSDNASAAAGSIWWDTYGILGYRISFHTYPASNFTYGNFAESRGYIGVRFDAGGGDYYYGWIQYEGKSDNTAVIIDWAYEDEPNVPLHVADIGPEIAVLGDGVEIPDGAASPDEADDTDFGTAEVGLDTVTHTFTIRNTGTNPLAIASATLGGPDADQFSINRDPDSTVAAGGSTTFDVAFSPTAEGGLNATVTIASDDVDEDPYTFEIAGAGEITPVIPTLNEWGVIILITLLAGAGVAMGRKESGGVGAAC